MREKKPSLSSNYNGKDEDSVTGLIKKLETSQRDLQAFQSTVQRLQRLAQGLVERGHFDHVNIQSKQNELEASYSELQQLAEARHKRLTHSLKLFRFMRESDELMEWIQDQTNLAASEDYGTDVEHVEHLMTKYDGYVASLGVAESRVQTCIGRGQDLIEAGHPEKDTIKARLNEIKVYWRDLEDLAHARQEALNGARRVHVYDRTADETIEWVEEKQAALAAEGFGEDLETIQALVRKHEAFESELAAVKSQVEQVKEEARQLKEAFPATDEHVEAKRDAVVEAWHQLLESSAQRRERLTQAEQLQSYFDQHRDLMAWLNEMLAKITAPDLARDVAGAEALIARHASTTASLLDERKETQS